MNEYSYTGQKPFKYWVQTVLPTVYDDSLSYEELLNKVVKHLNNVIQDVSTVINVTEDTKTRITTLEALVNDYFENLNVQSEINNKLDTMAGDGSLSTIVEPILAQYNASLTNRVAAVESRVDEFISPASGVPTPEEVADIRVWYDGRTSENAGIAVRGQIDELNSAINSRFVVGKNKFNPDTALTYKYINDETGEIKQNTPNNYTFVSERIATGRAEKVVISYVNSVGKQVLQPFKVYQYQANDTFISMTNDSIVTLAANCDYIRIYGQSNFTPVKKQIMVELGDNSANNFTTFKSFQIKLAKNVDVYKTISSVMSKAILSPTILNIKLIGDSITQGVGSSDYSPTGDVIVSDNPTDWRRNVGTKSWAAKFSARLQNGYDNKLNVTNNGIRGCSTHQIIYYWDELIDGNEDIVIVMLGTNNRTAPDSESFSYTMQSFYDELQVIKNRLELNGTEVIFMSAPPAGNTNESQSGIHFHMNDVDDVIAKFASDNNTEYLSLYKKTLNYMENTGATLDDLLDDSLHPNDLLYDLMYGWIIEGVGLNREHNPNIDNFMITSEEISEVLNG